MQGDFRGQTLGDLLAQLAGARAEGELSIDDRAGRHRVLFRAGRPVSAHVRGRFDPLLARLKEHGALDPAGHRAALRQLATTERRAGEVARAFGVEAGAIEDALRAQLGAALDALGRRVNGTSARFRFEARAVAASEIRAWPEPSSKGRVHGKAARPNPPVAHEPVALDRATFRRLARQLHPDRGHGLSEEERAKNAERLAVLTARWHGLSGRR
ncbi:MAG: DUF4388 domain-containing protein [Sandaracinus sp.]|nr:DUF4388 domain-containing protein [Sandaracinus sp.]MCB9632936.1 DUF4388 domain-containing protein [Sandaracinus sp.]